MNTDLCDSEYRTAIINLYTVGLQYFSFCTLLFITLYNPFCNLFCNPFYNLLCAPFPFFCLNLFTAKQDNK